jgi:hypothetical protein
MHDYRQFARQRHLGFLLPGAWVLGVIVFLIALSASGRRAAWEASGHEWVALLLGVWKSTWAGKSARLRTQKNGAHPLGRLRRSASCRL